MSAAGCPNCERLEAKAAALDVSFQPLTPDRWPDLEALFGERGACGGCWCMWWRLARKTFEASKGTKNKRAFQRLVKGGQEPGILAYRDGEPVGWCAIEPRASYPALARSRVLKPVDDRPVWSITCFFVRRDLRGQGLSVGLIEAAVAHARARGAEVVEAYPVAPKTGRMPDAFVWTGLPAAFARAGFQEVLRRSPTRPIMRRIIPSGRKK